MVFIHLRNSLSDISAYIFIIYYYQFIIYANNLFYILSFNAHSNLNCYLFIVRIVSLTR